VPRAFADLATASLAALTPRRRYRYRPAHRVEARDDPIRGQASAHVAQVQRSIPVHFAGFSIFAGFGTALVEVKPGPLLVSGTLRRAAANVRIAETCHHSEALAFSEHVRDSIRAALVNPLEELGQRRP